ncbi:MAG: EAL domain-containing protein [Thermodesulfobacteriota bacterium]
MRISRLFTKALLFMVAAFGLLAAAGAAVSALTLHQRLTEEFQSKAAAIVRSIAGSSVATFLSGDAATLQSVLDQYAEIHGVAYAVALDPEGRILAHTLSPTLPDDLRRELAALPGRLRGAADVLAERTPDGRRLQVALPVLAGQAGFVAIGMDLEVVRGHTLRAVLDHQLAILAVFLLCVAAAWVFMGNISRPLAELAAYARRVREHDFSGTISSYSDDEVGELARAFTSTAQELSGLIAGLEQRVATATGELQGTLAHLTAIVNNLADGLAVARRDGTIVQVNAALLGMFGAAAQDMVESDLGRLLGADLDALLEQAGLDACAPPQGSGAHACPGGGRTLEITARRSDGSAFPVEVSLALVSLQGDVNVIAILRDITERKFVENELRQARDDMEARVQKRTAELSAANLLLTREVEERQAAEQALRKAENKYRGLFENAIEGIFQAAPDGTIIDANPTMARIFGYPSAEEFMAALNDENVTMFEDDGRDRVFRTLLLAQGEVLDFESQVCRKDDRVIWISQNARAVRNEAGDVLFFEGSVEDITARKVAQDRLLYQAFHDQLTGLPNRTLFLDHLTMAMRRRERRKDYIFAVLYLDLDRFKVINDSLGHAIGDELLKAVAERLAVYVREVDTVARFGGDEFAVLLEDISAPREAIKIARRILDDISRPYDLSGFEVRTSASIGIVLITEGYETSELILRDADTAMYKAKEQGKARFKVFNQKMHDQAMHLLELENDLRKALEREEFVLFYQPIIDLGAGRLAGFEALVRWMHPQLGLVGPVEFIPLAEDTGLIFGLGEWVFRTACAQVSAWRRLVGDGATPHVAVNLSPKQFMQPNLVQVMQQIMEQTGADPEKLKVEITESVLMDNAEAAVDMLGKLRRLGLHLSIDDFGTGYSSLSYLQRFPVDVLKIDRSFIRQFGPERESQVLVRSIVSLARSLNLKVVAEGVDRPEQVGLLRELGCDFAQGYLFSRPVPADQAEALLRDESPLRAGLGG